MTFSISARCRRSGMLGVAVSTAMPGVGATCVFVAARVGAVATQASTNPYLGLDSLDRLREGQSATVVLDGVVADDPGRDGRQLGVVDAEGRSAAFTGPECVPWCGHVTGPDYSIQGNMLVGEETLSAMQESFLGSEHDDLPERLVAALEAGQAAGGDKRGRQSAAVKVYGPEDYPWVDVRVDEHPAPVAELRRVFEAVKEQLLPFVRTMPRRADAGGAGR